MVCVWKTLCPKLFFFQLNPFNPLTQSHPMIFFLTFCGFRIIIDSVRIYDMQPNSIITLITDFGNGDEYVGAMKGVMLSINPDLRFVDITHSIPPRDIKKAAFILYKAYRHFPGGTVHLIVVDPGVGGGRNPIVVETDKYLFVAPDNGVLSLVLADGFKVYKITCKKPKYTTFHGRDVFAPVAAKLASGTPIISLSKPISSIAGHLFSPPQKVTDGILGEVVDVDHFGNVITNIPRSSVKPDRFIVEIKERTIDRISETYEGKEPIAIWGSSDFLELSVPNGSLAETFNVHRGDKVIIRF